MRAGHISTVGVNNLNVFLGNAGRAVQDDGETGQTSADFFENVETEFGLTLELECAVRSADCDCERIDARLLDEFLNLVGVGVAGVFGVDFDGVFDAREFAQFGLDDNTVVVSVFDNLFGDADVFRESVRACVNHDGSETAVHAVLAESKAVAVVKVQSNGKTAGFDRRFDHFLEVDGVGVLSRACGDLQNKRSLLFGSGFDDTLDNLHIVDVERTDGVTAVVCFLEHFGSGNQWHKCPSKFD